MQSRLVLDSIKLAASTGRRNSRSDIRRNMDG